MWSKEYCEIRAAVDNETLTAELRMQAIKAALAANGMNYDNTKTVVENIETLKLIEYLSSFGD